MSVLAVLANRGQASPCFVAACDDPEALRAEMDGRQPHEVQLRFAMPCAGGAVFASTVELLRDAHVRNGWFDCGLEEVLRAVSTAYKSERQREAMSNDSCARLCKWLEPCSKADAPTAKELKRALLSVLGSKEAVKEALQSYRQVPLHANGRCQRLVVDPSGSAVRFVGGSPPPEE
eukprot:13870358-Alexandrium_andersonii.AAC.2